MVEPHFSDGEWRVFRHGIDLFNKREYWKAHEVWEELWKQRDEESRIFFQGLIQAAAAFHRIVTDPKFNGALNNIEKALAKLELFPDRFLEVDVMLLRKGLLDAKGELQRLGKGRMDDFPVSRLPLL